MTPGNHGTLWASLAVAVLAAPVVLAACATGGGRSAQIAGGTRKTLARPFHFPAVTDGRCPASRGRNLSTPLFASVAFGRDEVGMAVDNAGDLEHGRVSPSRYRGGWLALKTHFFSRPGYRGPFVVRARSLGAARPIRLGAEPGEAGPLVVRADQGANQAAGWREFPYFTFVRAPGCYGWQIDGKTFSETIVLRVLRAYAG